MQDPDTARRRTAARTDAPFDPEPWREEILAFVRRLGAGPDAEDIVQETFLRAITAPPSDRPRAWLHRVALNVLRDLGRRRRTAARELPGLLRLARRPEPANPAALAETRNLAERTARILATLPDGQRAVLYLRLIRHMDYDEIAVVLDSTVPAARQQFHVGLRAVRDRLLRAEDHG